MNMDLRYPIGKFQWPDNVTPADRERWIAEIEQAPSLLRRALDGLSGAQLDTPYRPGGWTPRQVAHHVPESHMHSFLRFRLALTEDQPLVKTYDETRCAELADCRDVPVETSLVLLECLHLRWVAMLRSLNEDEWTRSFRHPELGLIRLDRNLALYAWHGRHHAAHITSLRQRAGWEWNRGVRA